MERVILIGCPIPVSIGLLDQEHNVYQWHPECDIEVILKRIQKNEFTFDEQERMTHMVLFLKDGLIIGAKAIFKPFDIWMAFYEPNTT